MLKTYLTIAWRSLQKNRLYSLINITGLAVGMAVTLLIGLWVWDEMTANHAFANHSRLADIVSIAKENGVPHGGEYASVPMCAELKRRFPGEIKDAVLVGHAPSALAVGDKNISSWGFWTQRGFPEMFTLKMIAGDRGALADPYAILISRATARALFGQADPMNQVVRVGGRTDMHVKGVYEDIPENTRLTGLGFLLAWDNKDNPADSLKNDWTNHHFSLYVQVNERTDIALLSARIKDLTKPFGRGGGEDLLLHPMDRWNLYSRFADGRMVAGRAEFVRLFSLIGIFVLLLACINFMNLSTARSEHRAKEVGIRKTIGSLRRQLVVQFLIESFVCVSFALVLSLLLAWLILPMFNLLANKQLTIPVGEPSFWLLLTAFTVITSLLAGSYPAFYLSSFRPVKVLKGVFKAGRSATLPRKILVVTQFTVSVGLIIVALIIFRQLEYSKNRPVGYDREGLITVEMNSPVLQDHFEAIKDALLGTGT
ncbi:MAG: ABC transporter permease, partial [Bacteroidetes bacterium]|nr:ABC transporter permease [Bacteroidota bacterium]